MLNTLRRRQDYATLSRRGTFREWTREIRLREYVKRAIKATAAVALIILGGGAVYSLAEGRRFAESCYTALAIATTIGVSDELEPSSAAGRCFTVAYSLSTFVALPLLLNVAANGVARVGLTLWGAVAGYQLTRDPTLRHQRRLACVGALLVLHVLLFGGLMGYALTFLAPSYWESVYYAYMALSSIGVDSTVPHTPAAVAYVAYYVLAGLGLLTLVAEDVYGLYCVYKAYLDDDEDGAVAATPSPRLLRRDSSQIEGRSLNWVLGTVYNVLNLPRRLSAQALATATTNPLRP